ncbi:protein OSCP1 isoform X1 [Schistocerca nitens]|uniref:protein OSCP1 isoform X1 n=2 Tax=Schistocerca nitens TaxID=7011 RepID=UPI0021179F97|nr:protein OSCP1 isoform X1 [Schistocerca nitens]
MSNIHALPLLFLNLGGEMIYILEQRLHAQQIPQDKSVKVLTDIVSVMLNERFLQELFKPQEIYNKQALKKLFEDLAHASIMRLNTASMDKLYDLMTMVFKYQVFMASHPHDLILITLNHLDAIWNYVRVPSVHKQIVIVHKMIMQLYGQMSVGELLDVRKSILNFFQDLKIRVSVFMRQKLQNSDGKFVIDPSGLVPPGCDIPGEIRSYDETGEIKDVTKFDGCGDYQGTRQLGSFDIHGNRNTDLGCNIYASAPGHSDTCSVSTCHTGEVPSKPASGGCSKGAASVKAAQGELNLLMTQLLGNRTAFDCNSTKDLIHITLFGTEVNEREEDVQLSIKKEIKIDARRQSNFAELDAVSREMTVDDNCEETPGDLLELLDSLN